MSVSLDALASSTPTSGFLRSRLASCPEVVVKGGQHPSPYHDVVAWTDSGLSSANLHVTKLDGTEIYAAADAVFPDLLGDLVAYLHREGETYALAVDHIPSGTKILELPWVGFPLGSGPILGQNSVFFESRSSRRTHAVWRAPLDGDSDQRSRVDPPV